MAGTGRCALSTAARLAAEPGSLVPSVTAWRASPPRRVLTGSVQGGPARGPAVVPGGGGGVGHLRPAESSALSCALVCCVLCCTVCCVLCGVL